MNLDKRAGTQRQGALEGVFEFTEKRAKDVMTPRTEIEALPTAMTVSDAATRVGEITSTGAGRIWKTRRTTPATAGSPIQPSPRLATVIPSCVPEI